MGFRRAATAQEPRNHPGIAVTGGIAGQLGDPICDGETHLASNRELAKRLFVSEATIKSHLSHIYTKLEVDTRAAAVARAIEQRIIRPPA